MKVREQISIIPLNDIVGLHPRVIELNNTHTQQPYLSFEEDDFSPDTVQSILSLRPIIVRKAKLKFVCIGNVQSYLLAKKCLPSKCKILVCMNKGRFIPEVDQLYWAEHALLHLINDLGPNKAERIMSVWKEFRACENPWKKVTLSRLNTFQKLKRLLERK